MGYGWSAPRQFWLKIAEYAELILGLIFLRLAEVKYPKFEAAINESSYGDICITV